MSAALITVDVDSLTPMIDEVPRPLTTKHVDELEQRLFGIRVGVPRILSALRSHNISATFFVPGMVAEKSPDTVAAIVADGHEVGLHGWRHTPPRLLSERELQQDFAKSHDSLLRAGASEVCGYRAPEWNVTAELIAALNKSELLYDSSLAGYETLYRIDGREAPVLEVPVSWALDDAPYLLCTSRSYARPMSGAELGRQWCQDIDAIVRHDGVAVLTVHPWIIGRAPAFEAFEQVLGHVAANTELWTGTAADLIRHTDVSAIPLVNPLDAQSWWEEI